ncbi:MAG: YggS family pyridoxal phosphate-dependent enzyme, partial [Solirubrobacterales bacterium]|nr:YggS family pyridoxal phosphate-dependent enzyme [Solirubrobacterales bacterium]
MVDQLRTLSAATVAANLERIRDQIGPDVEILAAIKYLPGELLPGLAAGGVSTVGENRAQDLMVKQAAHGELFANWDFIGALQSRKVKDLLGRVRYIHSLASESALKQLQ